MRTILLAAALLALSQGAVLPAGEPDPRAQARGVYAQAAARGDWWTCLQLEDWGRDQKPAVQPGSVFNASEVVGRPRWAFPAEVAGVHDLGDEVIVVCPQRVYRLAPDGRPLSPSLRSPFHSWSHALGPGGRSLLQMRLEQRDQGGPLLQAAVMDLATGKTILGPGSAEVPRDSGLGDCVAAADGSAAVLVTVQNRNQDQLSTAWLLDRKGLRTLPGLREPAGVGPGAAWVVARERGKPVLCRGKDLAERQPLRQAAVGPGVAAVLAGEAGKDLLVVDAKGATRPLAAGVPLGEEPALRTIGGWLVVWSGRTAAAEAGGPEPLPSAACHRWEDLAAGKAVPPQVLAPCNNPDGAHGLPAALLRWQESLIELVDLDVDGPAPRMKRFADAGGPVSGVWSTRWFVVANRADGGRRVYDWDGRELWRTERAVADLVVTGFSSFAVMWQAEKAQEWTLVRADPDPAKRAEQPLRDLVGPAEILCDPWAGFLLAVQRQDAAWRSYDNLLGAPLARGRTDDGATPRPDIPWWPDPRGRFSFRGARVHPKAEGRPEDPLARLEVRDAWRLGGRLLVLSGDGQLLLFPRGRKGPPEKLGGRLPEARLFGLSGKSLALRSSDSDHVLAKVQPDPPKLLTAVTGTVADPPEGPWKAGGSQFTPPGSQQRLQWAEDRCPSPMRLRSPDAGGLLVVTPALVVDVSPAEARLVAAPVKKDP